MFKVRFTGVPSVHERSFKSHRFSADVLNAVDQIWTKARASRPNALSDGSIFNVSELEWPAVHGHFIDYKFFFAAQQYPHQFSELNIRPLAVTGITDCDGGLIFGRRAAWVTQDPGSWEFAPSGGLEPASRRADGVVDFCRQLKEELSEETGLSPDLVGEVEPWCVVEDNSANVLDIVTRMYLDADMRSVEKSLSDAQNNEYQEFRIMNRDDARTILFKNDQRATPLTEFIIQELM